MVEKKDIPGYEGLYQACSSGRIWSIKRTTLTGVAAYGEREEGGCFLIESLGGFTNTERVWLSKNGKKKQFSVKKLIALAFLGPKPQGYKLSHKDDDKFNHRADNLYYKKNSCRINLWYKRKKENIASEKRN